jgi:hypothetical protein
MGVTTRRQSPTRRSASPRVVVDYTLCIEVNCHAGTDPGALTQVSEQNLGP